MSTASQCSPLKKLTLTVDKQNNVKSSPKGKKVVANKKVVTEVTSSPVASQTVAKEKRKYTKRIQFDENNAVGSTHLMSTRAKPNQNDEKYFMTVIEVSLF